jgi:hypothetical protein
MLNTSLCSLIITDEDAVLTLLKEKKEEFFGIEIIKPQLGENPSYTIKHIHSSGLTNQQSIEEAKKIYTLTGFLRKSVLQSYISFGDISISENTQELEKSFNDVDKIYFA